MAKKFNYLPWIIGGAAAWYLLIKPKSIKGIGEVDPYDIGIFYRRIDKYISDDPEKGYRILNKIFKRNFNTWLTKKVNGKRFWNNKFITNMTSEQFSTAYVLMSDYFT